MSNLAATLIWYIIFALLIEVAFLIARKYRRRRQREEWKRTHQGLSWEDWKHVHR